MSAFHAGLRHGYYCSNDVEMELVASSGWYLELTGTGRSLSVGFLVDTKYSLEKAREKSFAPIVSAISGLFRKSAAILIGSSSATAFGTATSGNGVVQTLHRVEEDVTTARR